MIPVLISGQITTQLYITVYDGLNDKLPIKGHGMLYIRPLDFARQITTIDATGTQDMAERLRAISRFSMYFAGDLYHIYGGILVPPQYFDKDLQLRFTRYQGGKKGPLLMVHGAGVSSKISVQIPIF